MAAAGVASGWWVVHLPVLAVFCFFTKFTMTTIGISGVKRSGSLLLSWRLGLVAVPGRTNNCGPSEATYHPQWIDTFLNSQASCYTPIFDDSQPSAFSYFSFPPKQAAAAPFFSYIAPVWVLVDYMHKIHSLDIVWPSWHKYRSILWMMCSYLCHLEWHIRCAGTHKFLELDVIFTVQTERDAEDKFGCF